MFRIKLTGLENIPDSGAAILCVNHMSNFDPLVLRLKIKRKINFMGKKELFVNKLFSYTLEKFGVFPVDRSKNDLQAYRKAISVLKEQNILGIFIQGTRNKNIDNAKDGAAMFAMKTNSPVIPIGISASYKLFSVVNINIGKPISLPKPDKINQESLKPATDLITEQIKFLVQ